MGTQNRPAVVRDCRECLEDFIGSQGPQRSVALGREGGREGGENNYALSHLLSIWACLVGIMEKCQKTFENSCRKNTFPVAVAVLTNKTVM